MNTALLGQLRTARVMAILRRADIAVQLDDLVAGLRAHGVRAIECTLGPPDAMTAVRRLREGRRDGELVGAGTVTTAAQVDQLAALDLDFAVSPHLDEALLLRALDAGLPLLPGVATPTELARAVALGAPAVKLFPAGPLGIGYLRALRGPFPDVPVVPTGGIAVEDVPAWLDAGALCVGLGSALTGDQLPAVLAEVLR
jgi:2-dehydro-3-deoxyphosphogluconate aldolase/(4S)-4-hydroxy-2-oxoglutarate aldolase